MNVLMVGSECTPFIKTGGLADVLGSLPHALKKQGADVRIVLPKYENMDGEWKDQLEHLDELNVTLGWRNQYAGVEYIKYEGIPVYFIDNEYYFKRSNLYGYEDEAERFVFFNRAVMELVCVMDWTPDVLHCHDWQTGLIPVYLHTHYKEVEKLQGMKTVFTIHNLKYQGVFAQSVLHDLMDFDESMMTEDGFEFFGDINFMKGALNYADFITTVSETYAKEIQTPYYGENLDGVLRSRTDELIGIVNGIDDQNYNPMKDDALAFSYRSSLVKKGQNKMWLQAELGLPVRKDVPMIGIVSRLVEQKGFDLIGRVIDDLLYHDDVQVVLLGTGEYQYEQMLQWVQDRHPEKMSTNIRFSEPFSRQIYAASDLFLMPSRFEPCGIGQLIALRYLAAPIVRETGGLADTVQPYNEKTGEGNGFSFTNYNAHDMLYTIRRALEFYQEPATWQKLVKNICKSKFTWKNSADQYMDLYRSMFR
ncbi:starch synthase [Halobacillus karajensis]|uniref:Glycogen synthase n=1 Tax=Halobacillus karajensis TaxID=195088 RepID=A0A059NX68_9BACI|nr:glycogen synthase GlgA [Halobacillus karajensis]CDQ18573.1 Glycogen synthase [Halobacillus karajensis]CDQ23355.1 Glycogen synthase [Halobacillus karajensis]CDQ26837.1 Glycogen synthase [Halobacillus karajensis]SEH49735.1 starch synthase [Halobacillus karajensis]